MNQIITEILKELDNANIHAVFELIDSCQEQQKLQVSNPTFFNNLKQEFISGRYGADYEERLRLFIKSNLLSITKNKTAYNYPDIKINSNNKPNIYKDNFQCTNALWNLLEDKYEFNAETMSINFRGILFHSKHSKEDFSNLLGIEIIEFDKYLNGEKIPSLDIIFRLSKIIGLEMKFFFTPNFYGNDYLIQNETIRYSILKNIKPKISINQIENVNKFIGKVLYMIANKIIFLHDFLINEENFKNDYSKEFKGQLAHQYYKLLEQIPNQEDNDSIDNNCFTIQENIILTINPRIIVETIKEIKLSEKGEPILLTFFDDEIKNKNIYGRTFDEENLQMIFYDEKET